MCPFSKIKELTFFFGDAGVQNLLKEQSNGVILILEF